MIRKCKQCNKEFNALEKEIKRGYGLFCTRNCSSKYNALRRIKVEIDNCTCAYCNKLFYKCISKLKKSKSGLYFCCRKHKDLAQKLSAGFKNIWPTHYGTNNEYRNKALRVYGGKCNRCEYDKDTAAIIVHHKDRNHSNNSIDNLEVLCSNCHAIEHWSK
jgi:hypothetical protein